MLSLDKIYHAAYVLKGVARKTDLIAAPQLVPGLDELYLKTENLQVTGSFKLRGAYYKISQLPKEALDKGIIACSAGNHAQGVALAATHMGVKSIVCMPDGAPIMKVENTRRLGAEVRLVPGTYDDAHDEAVRLQEETGATFIHPYDDEDVIAGQGTIGLEIMDTLDDVDAVIVPVGGGGLISGVACAVKSLKPSCKVYGVQAKGASAMADAFHAGAWSASDAAVTFADGIAVKNPGDLTFQMAQKYVDDMVTVSDDEIAAAILNLMERQKLVSEGAGAAPVAACHVRQATASGQAHRLRHLWRQHRREHPVPRHQPRPCHERQEGDACIKLTDKPGQLEQVSRIIASLGANVVSVDYDLSDPDLPISACTLRVGMETRDQAQIDAIKERLVDEGFQIVG
jgi:threonine dehydratase